MYNISKLNNNLKYLFSIYCIENHGKIKQFEILTHFYCLITLYTGLQLVFSKFFLVFKSIHIFDSILSLKLSLMNETVLNRIKTLKRHCKVTLNEFLNKKNFMMTTKKYLFDKLFVSNRNFTA